MNQTAVDLRLSMSFCGSFFWVFCLFKELAAVFLLPEDKITNTTKIPNRLFLNEVVLVQSLIKLRVNE